MAQKKGNRRDRQPAGFNRELSDDSFEKMMAESMQSVRTLDIGDEVEAFIIGFDNDHVFLDVGTRLDGILKKTEIPERKRKELKEGQSLTVFISGKHGGTWLCSTRLGGGDTFEGKQDSGTNAAIMALEDAYTRNLPVEGRVTGAGKGGFEVMVMGIKAFCPISQIALRYCDNPDEHLEQTYTFEIVRFEDEGDKVNFIVSRREFLAHEEEKRVQKLWEKVEEGAVYEGKVSAVRDFGAFVDIGGIEGLLHISEISYKRLEKTEDALEVGQMVDVVVKNVDRERRKLSLSAKSLLDDPWVAVVKKLSVGSELQGKVVRMKTFGAFIELFPGVDGMVHISKLGTDRRHQHPKEVLKIGDNVTVRVLDIDSENRKISLTLEKEEVDFSQDLKNLKSEQDKAIKSSPTHMASAFDDAMKNDEDEINKDGE
jgi:small subunit ribosomal protein S1